MISPQGCNFQIDRLAYDRVKEKNLVLIAATVLRYKL